jgi:para-aminobenzoate synthetase/4-amino-4-deoxychorismate lyase
VPPPANAIERFSLFETMRLENGALVRQSAHVARMASAADVCGIAWDPFRVAEALARIEAERPAGTWRVRLLVDADGRATVECGPMPRSSPRPWRVGFAARPVVDNPFLRMKTTRRRVYDDARDERPDVEDVLLWASDRDVTESTIANLILELDGERVTPPASSPLLPGVFRTELLASGQLVERPVSKADVRRASRLWLVNSLREWIDAVLVDAP